jgi:hypothetical protein
VDLTRDNVRELLDYAPATGLLIWRVRDRKWFPSDGSWKMWNRRFSGLRTGAATANQGYATVVLLGKHYLAQRIIWLWMTGEWPGEIDHENHDRADNRWANLRDAGRADNRKNLSKYANNTSGVCGVRQRDSKWQAYIRVGGHLRHLGLFENEMDASVARKAAEVTYGFHENHGRM